MQENQGYIRINSSRITQYWTRIVYYLSNVVAALLSIPS